MNTARIAATRMFAVQHHSCCLPMFCPRVTTLPKLLAHTYRLIRARFNPLPSASTTAFWLVARFAHVTAQHRAAYHLYGRMGS